MHPVEPMFHHAPQQVAPDTWLIRQLQGEGTPAPVNVYINSLVIRGAEPAIVDCGTRANRKRWMDDVFGLVDPDDVKWVIITHDDHDHTGNLAQVMETCPNATLVANWFITERMTCEFDFPLPRMRWVNDADTIEAGDRTFLALRPPVYDNPTSRGLFDTASGVYWAVDCFATPVLGPTETVADLDPEFWAEGFAQFQRLLSPWHLLIDRAKWEAEVNRVASLRANVVVSGHAPVMTGTVIDQALGMLRRLPDMSPAELPGQFELEAMLAGSMPAGQPTS
jgi:flavorubredoxin